MPSLPAGFDAVIARALAKKADERFQTALEFQAAMLQALRFKAGGAPSPAPRARRALARPRLPFATRRRCRFRPETLAEIERSLSRHVGPLATLLVKRTQGEAASDRGFLPRARREHSRRRRAAGLPEEDGHA